MFNVPKSSLKRQKSVEMLTILRTHNFLYQMDFE